MILCCPACETRFRVPDTLIGAGGRKVRCGACAHIWRVGGEEGPTATAPSPEAPPQADRAPERRPANSPARVDEDEEESIDFSDDEAPQTWSGPDPEGATDGSLEAEIAETMRRLREGREDEDLIEGMAPPALRPQAPRPLLIAGWCLWLAFIIALPAAFVLFGERIEAVWPAAAHIDHLFGRATHPAVMAAGGEESDAPAYPLRAADVLSVRIAGDPEWLASDAGWTLKLRVEVMNRADREVTPTGLSLVLIDGDNQRLRSIAAPISPDSLAPGETRRFDVVIENAPAETVGILHEWQ